MPEKNSKKAKKKEELPSFLQNLTNRNLNRKVEVKENTFHSNLFFFGECKQFHSTPHPISLGRSYYPQYSEVSDEDLNPKLFLPEHEPTEKTPVAQPVKTRHEKKRTEEPVDQYAHRCPGVRKAFVPLTEVFIPDFGETASEIESDTWREIPFCRVKSSLFESPEPKIENVTLSDMKEKKRALLPYEQRMAHNHFPKEFITVKLVGPVIPASITVTKIPSKRKRMSDFAFEVKGKVAKTKSSKKTVPETTERTQGEEEEGKEEEETEMKEIELEDVESEKEEVEEEEPDEEKVEEIEEAVEGKTEETEAPDEEKAEATGGLDEEKEAGEASENGAAVVKEEEQQAKVESEGENIENDKEE